MPPVHPTHCFWRPAAMLLEDALIIYVLEPWYKKLYERVLRSRRCDAMLVVKYMEEQPHDRHVRD